MKNLRETWRPVLSFTIIGILINQFIVLPYLWLWKSVPITPLPEQLWTVVFIFLGVYGAGRSLEKIKGVEGAK